MRESDRPKPVKRGDVVPSIPDHNLNLPNDSSAGTDPDGGPNPDVPNLPADEQPPRIGGGMTLTGPFGSASPNVVHDDRSAGSSGGGSGDGSGSNHGSAADDYEPADNRMRRDRRFPAGLLLAPGALALLVAASAGPIAGRNQLGMAGGMALALIAGGVAAFCFGIIAARSEPDVGRVLGPAGLVLATLAAGSSIAQMI